MNYNEALPYDATINYNGIIPSSGGGGMGFRGPSIRDQLHVEYRLPPGDSDDDELTLMVNA